MTGLSLKIATINMKLPWSSKEKQQRIQELEEKIQELEEERNRLKEKFEAEKERRSKLASEKQEAEEQKNKLQDKLRNQEKTGEKQKKKPGKPEWEKLEFSEARKGLEKLNSVKSPGKDLVTIYSPGRISELPDLKGLKNSLSSETYRSFSGEKNFIAFIDDSFLKTILKTRPFFQPDWNLGEKFEVEKILDFIEKEKIWVLISANKTRIFRESDGDFEKVEDIKNRVERKQKKGGFSQGRFERKREEQIQQHLDETREKLEELEEEEIFLLGEKNLCKDLPGEYIGGFDSSKPAGPDLFYSFQLKKF